MAEQPNPSKDPAATPPPGADSYGEYDENGVDVSLLRSLLALSPLERLRVMERHARDTRLLNARTACAAWPTP
jgi:hypothetical protein